MIAKDHPPYSKTHFLISALIRCECGPSAAGFHKPLFPANHQTGKETGLLVVLEGDQTWASREASLGALLPCYAALCLSWHTQSLDGAISYTIYVLWLPLWLLFILSGTGRVSCLYPCRHDLIYSAWVKGVCPEFCICSTKSPWLLPKSYLL